MKNPEYFRGKSITVVGLARSGLACANLLHDAGARVSVTDSRNDRSTRANSGLLRPSGIKVELGRHTPGFIRGRDLVVISPGVEQTALPVVWAAKEGIGVISEVEAAWLLCPAAVIAVTGSSGKTTVTTLIGQVLKAAKKRAFVCGNIGNPFSGEVKKLKASDYVVLEISSFQLENIRSFKPRIAVITNVSRNHLDRYPGMREYIDAKRRISLNQDSGDYLILNSLDKESERIARATAASVRFFQPSAGLNPNQAAVLKVAEITGISRRTCLGVFKDFKGLEHRMEEAACIKGVKFINDSKATTVESAVWALENTSSPVILIAGGKDKGGDYRKLLGPARGKVKEVILIGQARKKIGRALRPSLAVSESDTLEEAVDRAFSKAAPGDCVILSPMCSSFDMFSDYEHRGRVFKNEVLKLSKCKGK